MNPVGKDLLTRMLPALHGDHAVYCALLHILIAAAEAACRFGMSRVGKDLQFSIAKLRQRAVGPFMATMLCNLPVLHILHATAVAEAGLE